MLRKIGISVIAFLLVGSQFWFAQSTERVSATEGDQEDLILLENVPEVETDPEEIQLNALNVYEGGAFTRESEGLQWSSSNKNVAEVNEQGEVSLTGQNGRTFIRVSDGKYEDRIAVDYKVDPSSKNKGKPDSKASLVKEKGDRYDLIGHVIDEFTIEEKLGQMLMPDFRNWDGENVTEMLPEIEELVEEYHLGGVILFAENVQDTAQTAELVSDYQAAAEKLGLMMTIDQEGGIVTRLQSGTDMPGNMALGAANSEELSYNVGQAIGQELESLGINTNFAPVVDVNNNPDNPVIGVRSFGEDPELVANMGVAYTEGLQSAGVAATAKHFPGHGDTDVDSHLGLPEVPHDRERLDEVELYPFQRAMESGIDMIMTAHVTFPEIDDTTVTSEATGEEVTLPATLSHKVLTELMREDMGYDGVITTDAMNMQAITDHFGAVDAAIRAVEAGSDIVLMPVGLEEVADGLLEAIDEGDISEERIEESVERILTLKLERGILKEENPPSIQDKINNAEQVVGSDEHKQVEQEAAEQATTLVKNQEGALPLDVDSDDEVVVVGNANVNDLADAVSSYHENITVIETTGELSEEERSIVSEVDAVITGSNTFNVNGRSPDNSDMQLIQSLPNETDAPVIAVGIRNPYDVMAYPEVDAYIAQYGFNEANFEATAATIFGENNPSGKLPVTIPTLEDEVLYEFGHGLSY
ncbi:glycoside hydrolase family 3 protein [Halalkalibacillus halophilus]|uniref:glycoside hydrolase family 3 protein n=1 Tax=Halalkalibacillus halophilus TaxID=392827 RepID=UPI0004114543|nr:glycoside hydrolase family 3 protein [Halalkalibacillus halophilus]